MTDELRGLDQWLTTPPDDNDEAYEEWANRYYDKAVDGLIAHLLQDVPRNVNVQTHTLHSLLSSMLTDLDPDDVFAWAQAIGADFPAFEDWLTDRAAGWDDPRIP